MRIPQRKQVVQPALVPENVKGDVGAAGQEAAALGQLGAAGRQAAGAAADIGSAIQRVDNWKKLSDAEIADLTGWDDYWNKTRLDPNYLTMATTLDKTGKSELEKQYEEFTKAHKKKLLDTTTDPVVQQRINNMIDVNSIERLTQFVRPASRTMIIQDEIAKIPHKLEVFVKAKRPQEASAYLDGLVQRGVLTPNQKEHYEGKIDAMIDQFNVNDEIAKARGIYDSTGDDLQALDYIRSSQLVPEDRKQELQQDIASEIGYRRASAETKAKEAARQAEESDLQVLSKAYISGDLNGLDSAMDYLKTAPGLTPEKKTEWADKILSRVKAIKDDTADPLKEYDPKTYAAFLKRSLDGTLTPQELSGALGRGKQGGISDSQFKYFTDLSRATPEQRTLRTVYQNTLKGITFSPVKDYDNLLYAQAATYLDEWTAANPKATADEYDAQIQKIITITKNTKGIGNTAEYKTRQAEFKTLRSEIYRDLENQIRSYLPRLNESNKAKAESVIQSQDPDKMKHMLSILKGTYND